VEQLDAQIQALPQEHQDVERRKRIEAWMDAGHGCSILREPAIADMVQGAFLFFDAQRYRLFAWVIMPNHVHTLFQPMSGWTVAKIVSSWKKFTATRISAHPGSANLPIGGCGRPVWHREYWDRYIRNESHFQQTMAYMHANPVKAGLVGRAEAWRWSSASLQAVTQESGVPGGMP
jgi:REP element-mobilizing transposase RayT